MKINNIILCLLAGLFLSSCYDDNSDDTVGFKVVNFRTNELTRSAVAGEGLDIMVGVNLGGVSVNTEDVTVDFELDTSLLSAAESGNTYELLPEDYYTFSTEGSHNQQMLIKSGDLLGYVTIAFDSLKLANDILMATPHYALPFRITDTSVDSIHTTLSTMIVPIQVMNTYAGNFYSIGVNTRDSSGVITEYETYGALNDYTISPIRVCESMMMDTVIVDGIANRGGLNSVGGYTNSMKLVIGSDNSVEILPIVGSDIQVIATGESKWEPTNRSFALNYEYVQDSMTYMVEETLMFRNRTRDGIDEWRWDGFDGN